jgi:hypothetical protein
VTHSSPLRLRPFVALVLAVVFVLSLAGCGRVMTPAELATHERHGFTGRTKEQVFRAAAAALRGEGYEIIAADAVAGRLRTAPRIIGAHAVGSRYSAVATSTSFAWTVDVWPDTGGAVLRAEPRGYNGAQRVDAAEMNAEWLEKAFRQLYREIDDNLPARGETPTVRTTGASVGARR